ncbi:MAG: hypothetical protein ACOX0U_02255 [Oscillospiraceae bacterium]|jgi:hypothetical protein
MSDFEDKLNQVLSSPDTMEQIMSLARSLGAGNNQSPPFPVPDPQQDSSSAPAATPNLLSLLGGGSGDGGVDPKMMGILLRAASAWNEPDDQKVALLNALRPFLKPERQEKINHAMQIAKISRVIRIALGVLKGGDDTV